MATTLPGCSGTSSEAAYHKAAAVPYVPNIKVKFSSQQFEDGRKRNLSPYKEERKIMKRPGNLTLKKFLKKLDKNKQFDFLKNTYCECFDVMKGDRSGTQRMINQVVGEQVVVKLKLIDVKKALENNPPKEKSPVIEYLTKEMEKIHGQQTRHTVADDDDDPTAVANDLSGRHTSVSDDGNSVDSSQPPEEEQQARGTLPQDNGDDAAAVPAVVTSTNAETATSGNGAADRTAGKSGVSSPDRPPSIADETTTGNGGGNPGLQPNVITPPCIIRAYSIPAVDDPSEERIIAPAAVETDGEFCKLVDAYSIRSRHQKGPKRNDDRSATATAASNGKRETRNINNRPTNEARKRKKRMKYKQRYYRKKMATENKSGVQCYVVVSDKEPPESSTVAPVAAAAVGGDTVLPTPTEPAVAAASNEQQQQPEDEPSEAKPFIADDQMPPLMRLNLVDPKIIDLSMTSSEEEDDDDDDDMDRPLIVNTGSMFDVRAAERSVVRTDKTVAAEPPRPRRRSVNDKSDDSEAMEIDLSPRSESRPSPPVTAFSTPAVHAKSVATSTVVRPKPSSCCPSSSTDYVQPSVHFPNTVFAEPSSIPSTSGSVIRRPPTALPPPPPIVVLRNPVEERTPTPFTVYHRPPSVMQPPPPPPPSLPLPPPLLPSPVVLVKDKIEDKTTAVREKIKRIVYESYRVYGRNLIIDMLVRRLRMGDLMHNMNAKWNTAEAEEVRELLVRLICSLSGSHCNIVPLMGCLMTTFRRTVDTTELTDVGTYREFLVFSEVVKLCVKSRDKQFFKTWLLPDSFKYGCFIVDDVLYGGLSRVKSLHHLVNWTKISLIRKYFRMPSYRVAGLHAPPAIGANSELRRKLSTAVDEGPSSKISKVGQPLVTTNQEASQSIMANNQMEQYFMADHQMGQPSSSSSYRPAISVRPQFNVNNFTTFQQNHQRPPPPLPQYSESSSSNSTLKQRLTDPPIAPTTTYVHKRPPSSSLGLVNTAPPPVHYGQPPMNPYYAKYGQPSSSYTSYNNQPGNPNQQQQQQQVREIIHHHPPPPGGQMPSTIQQLTSRVHQMPPMNQQQQMPPMNQQRMPPMNQQQITTMAQQMPPMTTLQASMAQQMPPMTPQQTMPLRPKPINVAQQQQAPLNQWVMPVPEERLPSYGQYPKQKPMEQTWVAHDHATGQSYPITTQVSPSLPDCESPHMPDRLDQPSTSGNGAKKGGLACAPKNPNQNAAQDMFDYSLSNLMP